MVELLEGAEKAIEHKYHLLHVKPTAYDKGLTGSEAAEGGEDTQKLFLKAGHMVEFDSAAVLHGPHSDVFGKAAPENNNKKIILISSDGKLTVICLFSEIEQEEENPLLRKRKVSCKITCTVADVYLINF